jgi:outer membrane protein assembly factor BamA
VADDGTGSCNDVAGAGNLGNLNGICNDIDAQDIEDFADLDETDVIGGNKFISSSFEYRFPISETVGLQGVLFLDMGNSFAENERTTGTCSTSPSGATVPGPESSGSLHLGHWRSFWGSH